MPQSTPITFTSQSFAPIPGEDEDTNPGVYGKALATWLASELDAKGYMTDDVIPEDFGWCIPVKTDACTVFVACANDESRNYGWMVFAFTDGDFFAKLTGKGGVRKVAVAGVVEAIREILSAGDYINEINA